MGAPNQPPTPESHIKAPSDMIAIGDNFQGTAAGRLNTTFATIERDLPFPANPGQPDIFTPRVRKRHQGQANVLFCDGHVEGLKLERLFFDRSDSALRRWNKDNEPHRERLQ